jgi:two-component system OmpR family response regulator
LQPPAGAAPSPGWSTAPRAAITFITPFPERLWAYLGHLRDDGYELCLATDVFEAANRAEALRPDLVFLDLGESSSQGLAMLRQLKADDCLGPVPLVMLASFESLADVHTGLQLGACDYVITTETSSWALARGVPGWVGIRALATRP